MLTAVKETAEGSTRPGTSSGRTCPTNDSMTNASTAMPTQGTRTPNRI
jgi:hypothetical protein